MPNIGSELVEMAIASNAFFVARGEKLRDCVGHVLDSQRRHHPDLKGQYVTPGQRARISQEIADCLEQKVQMGELFWKRGAKSDRQRIGIIRPDADMVARRQARALRNSGREKIVGPIRFPAQRRKPMLVPAG